MTKKVNNQNDTGLELLGLLDHLPGLAERYSSVSQMRAQQDPNKSDLNKPALGLLRRGGSVRAVGSRRMPTCQSLQLHQALLATSALQALSAGGLERHCGKGMTVPLDSTLPPSEAREFQSRRAAVQKVTTKSIDGP